MRSIMCRYSLDESTSEHPPVGLRGSNEVESALRHPLRAQRYDLAPAALEDVALELGEGGNPIVAAQ